MFQSGNDLFLDEILSDVCTKNAKKFCDKMIYSSRIILLREDQHRYTLKVVTWLKMAKQLSLCTSQL